MAELGKELDWTDEQMDSLLSISGSDLQQADLLWRESVPASLEDLLDAEDDVEDEPA